MPADFPIAITRGVTYPGFSVLFKDKDGAVVPLAGWKAFAEIRKDPESSLTLDLTPHIAADDTAGLLVVPPISHAATDALPEGIYAWGLMLETPAGERLEPSITGMVTIDTITPQPL